MLEEGFEYESGVPKRAVTSIDEIFRGVKPKKSYYTAPFSGTGLSHRMTYIFAKEDVGADHDVLVATPNESACLGYLVQEILEYQDRRPDSDTFDNFKLRIPAQREAVKLLSRLGMENSPRLHYRINGKRQP